MVLEKTLESPLDCKEIQSVPSKANLFWVFFGRIDAEAETPAFWTLFPYSTYLTQTVRPKGDQSWVFIGRTDAEAETPILWPPDAES